jgi:hypothetical protein
LFKRPTPVIIPLVIVSLNGDALEFVSNVIAFNMVASIVVPIIVLFPPMDAFIKGVVLLLKVPVPTGGLF